MAEEKKLPQSLTLAAEMFPPDPENPFEGLDIMELVGRMNEGSRRLRQVINESGNGRRFRETRDRLYQDVFIAKKD